MMLVHITVGGSKYINPIISPDATNNDIINAKIKAKCFIDAPCNLGFDSKIAEAVIASAISYII